MCTCEENNNTAEEYHTAFSELELSSPEDWRPEDWPPEDWRTSTRYEQEVEPEYISTSRRAPRRDRPRATRLPPRTTSRKLNLTAGVAIVPRRIDFDALSDGENEEDSGQTARETLQQLRNAAARSTHAPESTAASETYRVGRERRARRPRIAPGMTRISPSGKCLRI